MQGMKKLIFKKNISYKNADIGCRNSTQTFVRFEVNFFYHCTSWERLFRQNYSGVHLRYITFLSINHPLFS